VTFRTTFVSYIFPISIYIIPTFGAFEANHMAQDKGNGNGKQGKGIKKCLEERVRVKWRWKSEETRKERQ